MDATVARGFMLDGTVMVLTIAYRFFKVFSVLLKEMTFGKFVEKNLHLTKQYITAEDLEKNPPQADIYVTGSDQTWNSQYNGGVDRGFFLTFAKLEKQDQCRMKNHQIALA